MLLRNIFKTVPIFRKLTGLTTIVTVTLKSVQLPEGEAKLLRQFIQIQQVYDE